MLRFNVYETTGHRRSWPTAVDTQIVADSVAAHVIRYSVIGAAPCAIGISSPACTFGALLEIPGVADAISFSASSVHRCRND
jgi:hypothetical protein